MKKTNISVTNILLNDIKQAGAPVLFKKLSPARNDTYFYNSSRGSTIVTSPAPTLNFNIDANFVVKIKDLKLKTSGSCDVRGAVKWIAEVEEVESYGTIKNIREAILYDEQDHIPFSVWEGMIDEVKEGPLYLFQNVTLKTYFGPKVGTTKASSFVQKQPTVSFTISNDIVNSYVENLKQLRDRLNPKLCCPEVSAVTVELISGCNNKNCLQPVVVIQGEPTITCMNCNSMMKIDKLLSVFQCTITFDDHEKPLTVPLDVLQNFYKEDIIQLCQQDIKSFKQGLVFLEKVDFTYNTKNIVTNMKKHE